MKSSIKSIIILAVFLGITITTSAQVTYGLRTGLNYSAQADLGDLNDGNNFKPGFVIGAKVGSQLNKVLAISTEFIYQSKGGKSEMMVNDARATVERTSNYFTVPVLLTAGFSEQLGLNPEWKVYGSFGPYYSWLLNSKDYINNTMSTDQTRIEYTATETDWGLVYGMGVSHDFENFGVFSEIRYDMGLSKVMNYDDNLRNKTISLTVGINF